MTVRITQQTLNSFSNAPQQTPELLSACCGSALAHVFNIFTQVKPLCTAIRDTCMHTHTHPYTNPLCMHTHAQCMQAHVHVAEIHVTFE